MNKESLKKLYIESAQAGLPNAKCLPFSLYTEQETYGLEQEHIFHNDWVFVCAEQQLANCGDYFALTIAYEPIVVIRGKDNQLRALSNVCRHRGTLLNDEGFGHAKRMVCPYHAWTYADDGKLIGAPLATKQEVDKEDHYLPEFLLEVWQGLVFVSLNPQSKPLGERYANINQYMDIYDFGLFDTFYAGVAEHWQCNWKLAMENAMESYHLFKVHKETLETVTPTKHAFYLEGGAPYSLTGGKYKDNSGKLTQWLIGEGSVTDQHYVLISLPPSFVGILSKQSLAWISVHPASTTECTIRSGALSFKGKIDRDETAFTEAFFAEDKMICERVQRGMGAKHGRGGALIEIERIVVDFHQYLASRISGLENNDIFLADENIFIGKTAD